METLFTKITLRRLLVIGIVLLVLTIFVQLRYFMSGFLGAVTLYVLSRSYFLRLTQKYRQKKVLAASWIIFLIVISFGIPIWIILEILIPQINDKIQNPQETIQRFQPVINWIHNNEVLQRFDFEPGDQQLTEIANRVLSYVPSTLDWIGQFFANIFVALFILYFMLMANRRMEQELYDMLPFSAQAKDYFIRQNIQLIRSNAYGVPILAFSQGIIAIIGYVIFGVDNAMFWGLLTGIASVFPVVGTMVVWIPICIYQMATGNVEGGLMLSVYCLVLVGGIDNVLRFTLLKKMADIHPLITVFGVLLGLQLFGVMGLVFGPLLMSLPQILYTVFKMERHPSLYTGNEPPEDEKDITPGED